MRAARRVFAVVMVFTIYGGINFYIARSLLQWFNLFVPYMSEIIYIGAYIFTASSIFLSFLPLPRVIKSVMRRISAHWMGIFVYLLVFLLLADIIVLLGSTANLIPDSIPQYIQFYMGLAAVVLTVGTICYGTYNATKLKNVSYEIKLREASLGCMKMILIGDSHIGSINNFESRLEFIVQKINSLNADIVCIAGDIFTDDFTAMCSPDKAVSLFRSINATYGVFACLGNHDGGHTFDQMMDFLEKSNIKLLNDEYVIIDDRLVLFGRPDLHPIRGFGGIKRQAISDTIASFSAKMPIVVMEHDPARIDEYGSEVDLILAGHSHRGQIFPFNLLTRAMFTVDYGHYQKDADSPHVIVTSGVSTWGPPLRVGTSNEIVSIDLR